jgi:molecular chaperone HscB
MQAAKTTRQECWQCNGETGGGLVCADCGVVQPLAPDADLFAVLGLPRHPHVDAADLERRYHEASRAVHPDRFQTASPRERELSLAGSAAVNRAYRTLRDPVTLGRYWLELFGARLGETGPAVPPTIAAEVFETQEKLAELRAAGGGPEAMALRAEVKALRDHLGARLEALRAELVEQYRGWSESAEGLAELRRRLSETAYLATLFGDIDDALGDGLRGTHHRH